MLTRQDFIAQYESYSDVELYLALQEKENYSEEAIDALNTVINRRGGIEKLNQQIAQLAGQKKEEGRLRDETTKLYVKGTEVDFLKNLITSPLLSEEQTHAIVEKRFLELKAEEEDQRIKPRTVYGSLLGGALGSLIGGIIWGLQLIQMHRIFFILIAGLGIISYSLIRLFTRQSKANLVVLIATVVSVIIAIVIGHYLYTVAISVQTGN